MESVLHERRYLHPRLGHVLSGLAGSPLREALGDRVAEVGANAGPSPTGTALRDALAAHLWFLDRAAAPGGLPLTAAGWLKPAVLTEALTVLPTGVDWIHSATREIDVHIVSDFRVALQSDRLLRKHKNSLLLTAAGKTALADPAELWAFLAERLVVGGDDFTGSVAAVVLVHMATSDDKVDMGVVARTMAEAGWKDRDGVAATARELWPTYNALWTQLGNIGHRERKPLGNRRLSPPARALVRDALFLATAPRHALTGPGTTAGPSDMMRAPRDDAGAHRRTSPLTAPVPVPLALGEAGSCASAHRRPASSNSICGVLMNRDEIRNEVTHLAQMLAGPDPRGETYLQKVARLTMARRTAEEVVMAQLAWINDPELPLGQAREEWEQTRPSDENLISWAERMQDSPDLMPSSVELEQMAKDWALSVEFLQVLVATEPPREYMRANQAALREAANIRFLRELR